MVGEILLFLLVLSGVFVAAIGFVGMGTAESVGDFIFGVVVVAIACVMVWQGLSHFPQATGSSPSTGDVRCQEYRLVGKSYQWVDVKCVEVTR